MDKIEGKRVISDHFESFNTLFVFTLTRCIRPNEQMIPGKFDQDKVQTQLKYTGVLETTRIRQQVSFLWALCGCQLKASVAVVVIREF